MSLIATPNGAVTLLRGARLPFVLYAPARSGSSTLMRLLNCHPAIWCLWEPFNPTHRVDFAQRSRELVQTEGLDAALGYLATICNGFKHVWRGDGWPFRKWPELNHRLLMNPDFPVIVLTRRNALQRAISVQISHDMQLWTVRDPSDQQRIRQHTFLPLNIEQLRQDMTAAIAEEARIRELLAASGKRWCEVFYEELFSPDVASYAAMNLVQRLLDFLGVGPVREPARLEAMRNLLDPAATGFQNATAYQKIPNIHEVARTLGNPETGFVFPP